MASLMGLSLVLVFIERFKSKKVLGVRTIQLLSVSLIIPAIIILAIEKVLSGETVATIFGGLIGYVLSGVGNYEPTGKGKSSATGQRGTDSAGDGTQNPNGDK